MTRSGEQIDFFNAGLPDLVDHAIELLREHEPPGGYILCDSGGKDSYYTILELAKMAGVRYQAVYNVTTIDPPELDHPDAEWKRNLRCTTRKGLHRLNLSWSCHTTETGFHWFKGIVSIVY